MHRHPSPIRTGGTTIEPSPATGEGTHARSAPAACICVIARLTFINSQRSAVRMFCGAGRAVCWRSPRGQRGERSAERRSGACEAPFDAPCDRRIETLHRTCAVCASLSAFVRRQSVCGVSASLAIGTLSPLGAPPRHLVGARAALFAEGVAAFVRQRAPRSRAVVPGGRNPEAARGGWVTSPRPREPLPAPPSERLRRRPS